MYMRLIPLALLALLVPAVAIAQRLSFDAPSGEYPAGLSPMAVAIADLDGDLLADVAVANNDGDDVSIFLGTVTGDLVDTGITYDVGQAPYALVIADVNADGHLDIVASCEAEDAVSVLINDGSATFTERRFDTEGAPQGLVVRDLNGDGKLDIATANNFEETVTVLIGVGDGTFPVASSYDVGTAPSGLAAADFDGDRNLDLVIANSAGGPEANGSLTFLKGRGDGTFLILEELLLPEICGTIGCTPVALEGRDFNADTKVDLAVVNQDGDSVSVFQGNGDFTFAAPILYMVGSTPTALVVDDLDGDQKLDIVTTGSFDNFVSVLLGGGDGSFAEALDFEVGETPVALASGRLNGDTRPDLVVVNQDDETITVLLSAGSAGCAGDCDGDQSVEMSDLMSMVGLSLNGSSATGCSNGDADSSGGITVEEIVGAVVKATTGGCAQ